MKNISTGTGLCVLGLGIACYPILDRLAPVDRTAHGGVPLANVAKAVVGQVEPTIVWYGLAYSYYNGTVIARAWSNGRIEVKYGELAMSQGVCSWASGPCTSWLVVSDPAEGYAASADINHDQRVDGADLGLVLGYWGDAPRHDIPPSDCPLNLVNP